MSHRNTGARRALCLLLPAFLIVCLFTACRSTKPSGASSGATQASTAASTPSSDVQSGVSAAEPSAPSDSPSQPPVSSSAGGVSQAQSQAQASSAVTSSHPVTEPTSATYKTVGGTSLLLDYYPPLQSTAQRYPLVVYFHGGDWSSGNRQLSGNYKRIVDQFRNRGYAVVSADYRLVDADGVGLDQMLEDTTDAVRHMIQNASKYKIDPDRIALMGDGAGAHLALMTSLFPERYNTSGAYPGVSLKIGCVVSLAAPTDLSALAQEPDSALKAAAEALLGVSYAENSAAYDQASPARLLNENAPPVLLIHGREDQVVPYAQAIRFYDAAVTAKLDFKFIPVTSAGHTFEPVGDEAAVPAIEDLAASIVNFVQERLYA